MNDLFDLMTAKRVNKTAWLRENKGGEWKYDGTGTWWCDDGIRHVSRTSSCCFDVYCKCPPQYWLYGEGTPESICFI
jgi:hypothetical protein